ncbi:hypothetical protein chiPu_0026061 [Chiloscyllium punctatum]|uniref:Uncharacterized protein n=1 Tax=Chiloscyllium punctatum TaxID=137246 RepID=A0A401THK4_CHIPU|nr:hypothetical protein [Chiloscyllium punctatum]
MCACACGRVFWGYFGRSTQTRVCRNQPRNRSGFDAKRGGCSDEESQWMDYDGEGPDRERGSSGTEGGQCPLPVVPSRLRPEPAVSFTEGGRVREGTSINRMERMAEAEIGQLQEKTARR